MTKDDLKKTVELPEEFTQRLENIRTQYETIINGLNVELDALRNEQREEITMSCIGILEDVLDFLFLLISGKKYSG